MAAVDPGGFEQWKLQVDALIAHLPTVEEPFVVAGDLNTTTFRSKARDLLDAGLIDAHESLGYGMSASFKLAAQGVLAAPGAVVRLDHVLMSDDVRAVSVQDLPSNGSDHLPFVATLAVKQSAGKHSLRQALGRQALGRQALGRRAPGRRALGRRAVVRPSTDPAG